MKYSWNIDQRAALESGFNVDVIDLSIFALLRDFAAEPGCKKMTENGHTYYLFSWKLVTQQQQILGLNTKRSVTRRFEKLSDCDVINAHPDNKSLKMMWYRFGDGAPKLMRSTKNETDLTRNNDSYSLGTTVPSTRNENSYNNTIIDNSIKDKVVVEEKENWPQKILADEMFLETLLRMHKLDRSDTAIMLEDFILQKRGLGETNWPTYSQFRKNFLFWIPKVKNKNNGKSNNKANATPTPQVWDTDTSRRAYIRILQEEGLDVGSDFGL